MILTSVSPGCIVIVRYGTVLYRYERAGFMIFDSFAGEEMDEQSPVQTRVEKKREQIRAAASFSSLLTYGVLDGLLLNAQTPHLPEAGVIDSLVK